MRGLLKFSCLMSLFQCMVIMGNHAYCQQIQSRHPICYTTVSDTGYYMKDAAGFLQKAIETESLQPSAVTFTTPYYVRVFIRIVREDNGTLAGCTMADALRNFNSMKENYIGHNICFQLAGIDFVNDSYLNNFNTSSNLETVYPAYIRDNNLDVNGAVTVFVHYNFLSNGGSSGIAYGIPNNFFSVARWAAGDSKYHSIFGHEMGHCLGLYHTFERANGSQEAVTRNTGNSCYNCNVEGDLCCDTPADYEDSQDNTTSCSYSSTRTNTCDGFQYNPSTINIMSYQPWECISATSTAVTANQRTRTHATINDSGSPIFSRVAENELVLPGTIRSTNAVRIYSAKNNLSTGSNVTISHTGSSQAYYAAGISITLGPGVTFSPGAEGVMQAAISGCQ